MLAFGTEALYGTCLVALVARNVNVAVIRNMMGQLEGEDRRAITLRYRVV